MIQSGGGNPNVQLSPGMIVFGGRGGRGNEGQSQLDGLGTGAAINGGGVSGYGQLENAQEVVMTTAGGLGEAEVGGPVVNMIPKTGTGRSSKILATSPWCPPKRRTICGTSAIRSEDR
jgi:hypothetical protein